MSEKTRKALDELKRVRDEIRVKIDLAGKETKRWWDELEPQLSQVETKIAAGGEKVADMSKAMADEMVSAFRRLRDRIAGDKDAGPGAGEGEDDSGATDAEIVDE